MSIYLRLGRSHGGSRRLGVCPVLVNEGGRPGLGWSGGPCSALPALSQSLSPPLPRAPRSSFPRPCPQPLTHLDLAASPQPPPGLGYQGSTQPQVCIWPFKIPHRGCCLPSRIGPTPGPVFRTNAGSECFSTEAGNDCHDRTLSLGIGKGEARL